MSAASDPVSVNLQVLDGRAVVRASGEFDMATNQFLDGALRSLAHGGITDVTIDLEHVSFMDSAGLHPIIELANSRPTVSVHVVNARSGVCKLFRLHGVDSMIALVAP